MSSVKRSANFRTAMSNSAENRRCPKCDRKSAVVRFSDELGSGRYCRWDDCDYGDYRLFVELGVSVEETR